MTKVDRYLREVFSSPHLWKDVRVRLPDKEIDPQSVEILRVREIRDLDIFNLNFELETKVLQPHLERLSLRITTVKTLEALTEAASSGQLIRLRSLAFGCIGYYYAIKLDTIDHHNQSWVTFLDLFKCLPMLEEVCFGHFRYFRNFPHHIRSVPLTNEHGAVDLREALCCTGKLTNISLKCSSRLGKSWLKTVMLKNPHLQTLCLADIEWFCTWNSSLGFDDEADPKVFSNLKTFKLLIQRTSSPEYRGTAGIILSWAFPGNDAFENLTSLDLTGCHFSTLINLHPKFPGLKKLNLTESYLVTTTGTERNLFRKSWRHFPNLEWLQLKGCHTNELPCIFEKTGKTLHYLGLAKHHRLTDNDLRDLPMWFPVLKTLDLCGCKQITDAILVEWYIKRSQSDARRPKSLKKLVMKGCEGVSQKVVDKVQMKTRNQLLIEL